MNWNFLYFGLCQLPPSMIFILLILSPYASIADPFGPPKVLTYATPLYRFINSSLQETPNRKLRSSYSNHVLPELLQLLLQAYPSTLDFSFCLPLYRYQPY